ncbi:MAG: ArsR family transcriptional regulator [Candidatus Hodarchaeales archaeon]|jgi:DNA-binding transcriptional ArsR family regulator
MSDKLENRIGDALKLLADPTRRQILNLISRQSLNPQDLANELKISRPAIEKHLKLLRSNYLCDRTTELFPEPHYVYFTTIPATELINAINASTIEFFQSMDGIISAEIEQLERDFVLGRVKRVEYDTRKPLLIKKQQELEELQLTRIWVEEAKKLIKEYEKEIPLD